MNPIQKVILSLPQGSQRFSQRAQSLKNDILVLCEPCEFFAFFAVKILFGMDSKFTTQKLSINSTVFRTKSRKNRTVFEKNDLLRNPIKTFFYAVYQSNRNLSKLNLEYRLSLARNLYVQKFMIKNSIKQKRIEFETF